MTKRLDGFRKVYATSDWHCGHENVLVFDQRPFKDLDHMHRVLVNNYNSTVGPEDVCYFLGDMGLCKGETLASIIQQLNGTKVLVLGNHDKGASAMRRVGFDVVLNMAAIEVAGKIVTMTHCPLRGIFREDVTGMRGAAEDDNWHGEHKHARFSLPDFGQYHLHGHIHVTPWNGKLKCTHNQFDVGVAANEYRPVSFSQIESWIMKGSK